MNIVQKILGRLGYSLTRDSATPSATKKILALHPSKADTKPLISREDAADALKSVGRELNVPAFYFYKRPDKSSVLMEQLENNWWNAHGELIEKAWVFSEKTNYYYRKDYVSKAVSFFKETGKKAVILDLGCGSGWLGRMIADDGLEYHGMDFSSTQIDIANKEKQKASNKEHLHYYCLTDFRKIENISSVTGVVIHAFLHHLYWEDLTNLFDELAETLPQGCKFFIMEPVYPAKSKAANTFTEKATNDALVSAYRANLIFIKNKLMDENNYDSKTESDLIQAEFESTKNGFFFSPKEVPFKLDEFKTFLTTYLTIEKTFHCGVLNLETAQLVERIRSEEKQNYFSELLFPAANALDKLLLSNNYFEANENNYLFTVFECSLNKNR